jgi:tRNA (adenine57-N1/adenine58-N1)-methyltransferase
MGDNEWMALEEEDGRVYMIELIDEMHKIKGIGVLNPHQTLSEIEIGDSIQLGHKSFTRLPARLPELNQGMVRRAQTISAKDAGMIIAKMGIGSGDSVLEAGLGSGGLSMYLAHALGNSGIHITIEPRDEHAKVGLENLRRAKSCLPEFPTHHHIEGNIEDVVKEISMVKSSFNSIILDLPQHEGAINAVADLLEIGGRICCYCPVTSQVETAWQTCEDNGLKVEWAGELIERPWGRASRGGMRPVNGPFGHTAFLLIAVRNSKK